MSFIPQNRGPNTCGDPTLATTYYTAYSLGVPGVHGINTNAAFADQNTRGSKWELDPPVFDSWTSPGQINTVPLYAFGRTSSPDFVYLISTNSNPPPTPSGFAFIKILGYVYPSQICGSVPLYGATFASPPDHWYTTKLNEHNEIISLGWTDIGITAYVLPVNSKFICNALSSWFIEPCCRLLTCLACVVKAIRSGYYALH